MIYDDIPQQDLENFESAIELFRQFNTSAILFEKSETPNGNQFTGYNKSFWSKKKVSSLLIKKLLDYQKPDTNELYNDEYVEIVSQIKNHEVTLFTNLGLLKEVPKIFSKTMLEISASDIDSQPDIYSKTQLISILLRKSNDWNDVLKKVGIVD